MKKSVWLVGGDGWAYDIGYGGLDHVLANRRDVNILVMDTEVYSNTGGQASKATPLGAAAKFAAAGKTVGKKDLGLLANMYGHVYVAKVAFGAKMAQTAQAFLEAESYDGPSLIIAYSHCIAHGYDMAKGASQQKLAVDSGVWPLYRFDPRRIPKGEPPLHLDYGPPKAKVADYLRNESRFRMVERADPARYKAFVAESQAAAERRYAVYQQLAGITVPAFETTVPDERRRTATANPTPRRSDGPQHDVPRDAPAASADRRRRPARRRSRHGQGARRRRRRDARAALAVRRGNHRRADGRLRQRREPSASRFAEADTFAPESSMALGPDEYLEHLRRSSAPFGIPVMASLNGVTPGGWTRSRNCSKQAGADGLELHLYHAASDMTMSAADVERQAIDIVREVKRSVRIPVAVKLAPLFTAFAHFAEQLDDAGADGLVLFTRFHRVDIDVDELEVVRSLPLSDSSELPLRLRGDRGAGRPHQGVDRDHRRRPHRARRHQGDDGRRARDADGVGAAAPRPGASAHGPPRDRVVDAGARVELARRDARQHEPRADSRSGGVRTRQLPDGAAMTIEGRSL